jgi:carbonic anhydrase
VAGSKLILILGHSKCGAIKGACDDVRMGNLTALLTKLRPAVADTATSGTRNSGNAAFVEDVALRNVQLAMEQITQRSPILKEMVENGEIMIAGAMYDVENGQVELVQPVFA